MTRHYLSAIAAVATALSLHACSEPVSAPVRLDPSSFVAEITTGATLTPEALVSGWVATGVNEKGEIIGRAQGATCELPRFWQPDGSMISLPVGAHCGGITSVINNSGYIAGVVYSPDATALWTPNGSGGYDLQELELVDGHRPNITGINDAGEIVAHYGGKIYYRTLSSTSWSVPPSPAGATSCQLGGINNAGAFVGSCFVNGQPLTAYFWANHEAIPTPLPRPVTPNNVYAKDINDAGVIVGFIGDCAVLRALRWTLNAGVYTVEILPDAGKGGSAIAVTSNGTVIGHVYSGGGNGHSATVWPTSGGYQVLPRIGKATRSTEARDGVTTAAGATIVVGKQDSQAVRWR